MNSRFVVFLVSGLILNLSASQWSGAPLAAASEEVVDRCAALLDNRPSKNLILGKEATVEWLEAELAREKSSTPAAVKQLRNAIQTVGFRDAAYNPDIIKNHNTKYTHVIPRGPITDQSASGRCWGFAGFNLMRTRMIRLGIVDENFEFSENAWHFYNMFEKSNRYFEMLIHNRSKKYASSAELRRDLDPNSAIGDGGWFHWFAEIVTKYGVVPREKMPDTISAANTGILRDQLADQLEAYGSEIFKLINRFQKENGSSQDLTELQLAQIRELKTWAMRRVVKILVTHLGSPPTESEGFEYKLIENSKREQQVTRVGENGNKTQGGFIVTPSKIARFSPRSFFRQTGFNPDDYVVVTANPMHESGKLYEQAHDHLIQREGEPIYRHRLLNVEMSRLEELTDTSLKNGEPLYFAAQVEGVGKSIDFKKGIMNTELFSGEAAYDFDPSEAVATPSRAADGIFGTNSANHAMMFFALDQPEPLLQTVKRGVENSWGQKSGDDGILHMYANWFRKYVWQVIIPRQFLSPAELELWDQGEAVIMTPEEPFYGPHPFYRPQP